RRPVFCLWIGLLKISIEVTVRREDQHGILLRSFSVDFQGAQESVKLGIAPEGGPIDPRRLRIALATDLLHSTVGGGADLAQLFLHRPENFRTLPFSF